MTSESVAAAMREASAERRLSRRVLAGARLNDLPHDDFVDVFRATTGTFDSGSHDDGPEIRGTQRRQRAEQLSTRRTNC